MFCVIFCDVCYSVLCVIVVPLPPGINPLAVIKNIYAYILLYKCRDRLVTWDRIVPSIITKTVIGRSVIFLRVTV